MEVVKKFAETVQPYWAVMEPVLTVRTEADYDRAVVRLNELLDEVGGRRGAPALRAAGHARRVSLRLRERTRGDADGDRHRGAAISHGRTWSGAI